jgi:hypothetical protein
VESCSARRELGQEDLKVKKLYKLALLVFGLTSLGLHGSSIRAYQDKQDALDSERLLVYQDLIASFSKMKFKFLSNRTFSLDLRGIDKNAPCLEGLQLDSVGESNKATHLLDREVLRGNSIQLVSEQEELAVLKQRDASAAISDTEPKKDESITTKDPGVLALSEIAFDKSHRFAVAKYVFLCGSHCNSGAILVLEKVESQWVGTTRRPCSFAVNRDNPRP